MALSVFMLIFNVLNAQKVEIAGNGNLRSDPNISSKVIGKVTKGLKVTQIDYSMGWYKIELTNKSIGWIYQTFIKKDKPWDNDLAMKFFFSARKKYEEGDKLSALAELDSTTLYNPELYEAWIMSGLIKGMIGNTKSANETFSMAIEINAKKPDGYLNRGRAYAVLGEIEKACSDWKLAEKLGSSEAKEFINEFCNVKTNTNNEYIGHINEISTYPSLIIAGDCPLGALCEISLKEFENIVFKMSEADAIKYGLIGETKRIIDAKAGKGYTISPDDDNTTKIIGKGWKVKFTAQECNNRNSKKYMLVSSCKRIIQTSPAKK